MYYSAESVLQNLLFLHKLVPLNLNFTQSTSDVKTANSGTPISPDKDMSSHFYRPVIKGFKFIKTGLVYMLEFVAVRIQLGGKTFRVFCSWSINF